MNTAHESRQPRQRLKLFLPANHHCTAMALTSEKIKQRPKMSTENCPKKSMAAPPEPPEKDQVSL